MEEENKRYDYVEDVEISKEMRTAFLDYSMSVIVSRALPDVRDGMKPVHRRILHAMNQLGITSGVAHKKSARIVGEVIGKYHPHGDTAVYDAMVRMAQDFSYRYPLVDGHGNFGSLDGDGAAAMRYTEARMSKISMEMMRDIQKDTVDFIPNYDGEENEPVVLPSRIPNLLINGAVGIAVGMATNIPPHNLREVINAVVKIIDNEVLEDRETGIEELLSIVKGPDFPTGAMILGTSRFVAAEYSFFLSIPVMFGASFLKLVKYGFHYTGMEVTILVVGMLVAFIVSIVAIKFLLGYIKKNDFKAFGVYRIVLGIVVAAYFLYVK